MKYAKKLILLLVAILLTAGCAAPAAETVPPTQPPTVPVTEEVTEPEGDLLLEEFQTLFSDCDMIFTQAASHGYTRPEDLDLYYLFYNGFEIPDGFDTLDDHSRQLLMAAGYGVEFNRQTMPLDTMDVILRQYFGLELGDFRIPDAWEHDPDTDTWCSDHPRPWSGSVTVRAYENTDDGAVRLYLTVPAFVMPTGEIVRDVETIMTLRAADGGWRILSNVRADHRTEDDRLAEYQDLFRGGVYNLAAGVMFTRPVDVDLYYIFYNGVGYDGSWNSASGADRDLLVSRGFWRECDIQVMPAHILEEKLQRHFGVGLADVRIPGEWAYSAESDTWYSNHNDAFGSGVSVNGFTDNEDGTVTLFLTVDAVYDHAADDYLWDQPMHMTLRETAEGWQMVSNVAANAGASQEDTAALAYYQNLLDWSGGLDYFRALGTIFNTTEDVDLYYFFYGGVDVSANWDDMDDYERNLLLEQGFDTDWGVQKLPGHVMEERLQRYFGLGLDAFEIPAEWASDPETETWYSNHSDAWLPVVTVTDVEEFEDGTVRVYLTVDMVIDHAGEFVSNAETVLTLRKTEDGSWQMVTHAFAQDVV